MRNVIFFWIVSLGLLSSCSEDIDSDLERTINEEQNAPTVITLSRSSIETLSDYGINEISIYAYMSDSLVCEKRFSFDGSAFEVPLPLGENIRTFVVAGAGEILGTDKLSTAYISQKNIDMQRPVYISDVIGFTSDNSLSSLSVEIKQIMGQAVFTPIDAPEALQATSYFDELKLTFTNVGTKYFIESGKTETEDVVITSDISTGYSAFIYSFPTVKNGTVTSIDVIYSKEGEEVNRTLGALDTGIVFESLKRWTVKMELLNPDWIDKPWDNNTDEQGGINMTNTRVGKSLSGFEIEESFYEF